MKTKATIISSLIFALSFVLMSHAIWMESTYKGVPGDEVVLDLYFGEFEKDLREKDEKVNSMVDFKALYIYENKKTVPISLQKTNQSFRGRFKADQPGFYQILAVNDEREVQDWTKHGLTIVRPVEYQRSSFTAFSEKKTAKVNVQPYFSLDIIPDYTLNHNGEVCSIFENGKVISGTIYFNKKPLSAVDIKVYSPAKKISTTRPDANGKFSFTPEVSGIYLLTASLNDSTAGKYKGKDFKFTRYHVSTTVNVD